MKKNFTRYTQILLQVLVLVGFGLSSLVANAQKDDCSFPLILSTSLDWYPYLYINEEGDSTGSDIELLRKVLKRVGCELDVVHFPERRSLHELKKGNFDIWLGASYNKARASKYHYSVQYRNEINRFAYNADDSALSKVKTFQDIIDLDKIIAINLAGWYGDELENSKKTHNNYTYSDTVNKRLKMLNLNRVDVVIDDYAVLCSEVAKGNYKKFAVHPFIIYETPIHFLFNRKTVTLDFVKKFNAVLDEMRENGTLAAHFSESLALSCSKSN